MDEKEAEARPIMGTIFLVNTYKILESLAFLFISREREREPEAFKAACMKPGM